MNFYLYMHLSNEEEKIKYFQHLHYTPSSSWCSFTKETTTLIDFFCLLLIPSKWDSNSVGDCCVWCLFLNILSLTFVHVSAHVSSFFSLLSSISLCEYATIYSLYSRYTFDGVQYLAFMNEVAVNILVHTIW